MLQTRGNVVPTDASDDPNMWLPDQLRMSKKLGPFEGEGGQIFVKIQWYTKVETTTKMIWILIKNRHHDTKKYFLTKTFIFPENIFR